MCVEAISSYIEGTVIWITPSMFKMKSSALILNIYEIIFLLILIRPSSLVPTCLFDYSQLMFRDNMQTTVHHISTQMSYPYFFKKPNNSRTMVGNTKQ